MMRPIVSFALTSIILLSQVGLPVHFHYCKGMLESVSVFFNPGCDDHEELTDLPACCRKLAAGHCSKQAGNCCDDQVKVLTQDITSLMPHFVKWVDLINENITLSPAGSFTAVKSNSPFSHFSTGSGSGPPRYILHQALILYA